jgi:hypothetical protein
MLTISNERYVYKQKQLKIYFFPVVAFAVLVVVDLVDFFDGSVRCLCFFVSVIVVSPVK